VLAGPEMPNFQSFWRGHRPSGRVIRLGVLDARQKRDFFAAIDAFALPSRSDSFGLVLLEAWANGVPNLAYRAGGIGWVIHDEKDGLLVRCGDIPALAAALLRLSRDAGLRHRLGAAGLERTRKEFEWMEKFEMVRQVYREIMHAGP
jgi:glycosyltransferase involved in cell wall biosynthesis